MSPHLVIRRHLRRRNERGAAVFVVVLVVTLLSALGLFALKNATLANSASGYNRQLTQVHYVTDYAVVANVAEMMENPHETFQLMSNYVPDTGAGDEPCQGMAQLLSPTCRLVSYDDLDNRVQAANGANELLAPAAADAPGSLGPVDPISGLPQIEADMRIELTDLYSTQPPAGYELGGGAEQTQVQSYAYVTVTSSGIVRPPQAVAGTWDARSAGAAAVEVSRAHIKLGPLPVQK
jgi:hypothetical protein